MKRTMRGIQAKAMKYNGEGADIVTVNVPVKDFTDKSIEKAVHKYNAENDCGIIMSTVTRVFLPTSMTLDTWCEHCTFGEPIPYTEDADATTSDEE